MLRRLIGTFVIQFHEESLMKARLVLFVIAALVVLGASLHAATDHAVDTCILCALCPFC